MSSPELAAIPLARNAVTFSFCHGSRSARTAIAILVSKRMVMGPSLAAITGWYRHRGRPGRGVLNAGAVRGPRDNRAMPVSPGPSASDWARYWRADGVPVEAMHAHFTSHVYHRHSHESYSFGVTEAGAQAFTCRRGRHVSGAGMVMIFNPDDPHDGHAAGDGGFTYLMVHIWPGRTGTPPSWNSTSDSPQRRACSPGTRPAASRGRARAIRIVASPHGSASSCTTATPVPT